MTNSPDMLVKLLKYSIADHALLPARPFRLMSKTKRQRVRESLRQDAFMFGQRTVYLVTRLQGRRKKAAEGEIDLVRAWARAAARAARLSLKKSRSHRTPPKYKMCAVLPVATIAIYPPCEEGDY